jgi:SAM-dependent methyltransferase
MEKNEYAHMFAHENSYWWYRGLHELVEKYVLRHAAKTGKPLVILDAGCGTGKMMELLQRFGTVRGFDVSLEAIKFCNERNLGNVENQDLNSWEPPTEKFDIVLCLDVLYHRNIIDDNSVRAKFFHALKPGGILIENLPAFELLRRNHDKVILTKRRFTRAPVVKKLKECGFCHVFASYRLPFLFVIMLFKKIFELFFKSKPDQAQSDLSFLPTGINSLLLFYNRLENAVISMGISLPIGGSLFIVARK